MEANGSRDSSTYPDISSRTQPGSVIDHDKEKGKRHETRMHQRDIELGQPEDVQAAFSAAAHRSSRPNQLNLERVIARS